MSTDNALPREERFTDCTGTTRKFLVERRRSFDGDVHLRATELIDRYGEGRYVFESRSSSYVDAVAKLQHKISAGLAVKYILPPTSSLDISLSHDRVRGRISAGGFVVDGRLVEWGAIAALLATREGMQFDLFISPLAD